MKLSSHWGLDKSIEFCQCPQKVDKNVDFSWANSIDTNEVILPSTDYKLSNQIKFL